MLVGILVLFGWMFGLPLLKSILPGFVTMKANTAICFILLGLTLYFLQSDRPATASPRTWRQNAALASPILVAIITLLTLSEYLFEWNAGINELLFVDEPHPVATAKPGQMAPATAINFLLLSFVLLISQIQRKSSLADTFAIMLNHAVAVFSFIAILGYLYGVEPFSGLFSNFFMAIHTSLTFLILSSGIICAHPNWRMVQLLLADDPGGASLRVLLPSVTIIIVVIGLLRIWGENIGLYSTEFGVALNSVAVILLILPAVWWNAFALSRSDQKLRELTLTLAQQTNILNSVLDSMGDGVVVADMDGKFIIWNKAARRLVGRGSADVPSQQWSEYYGVFLPDQQTPYPPERSPLVRALQGEPTDAEEQFLRHPDNPQGVWLSVSGRPLLDPEGTQHGGVVVFNDITGRKQAEHNLKQLNIRLENANKELEAFSYSVSHDLRAPLRHIDGFTELLVKRAAESLDDQSKRYLHTIGNAAKHMGALIDDLLVFSRMGRAEMRRSHFDSNALVREAIASLSQETAEREIDWNVTKLPGVTADREMLGLVFQNLLGNAVKYTRPRPQTQIEIGCRENSRELVFYVRDNGVGFDMKYVEKLFGVFQRLHRADEFEGTGIGLANVRRIISRHGGKTWAEGVLDKGATFYFSLPVETPGEHTV